MRLWRGNSIETEKKYAPSAWKWVAGSLLAAATLAALMGIYIYFYSPH
jgi:hypothetical protein